MNKILNSVKNYFDLNEKGKPKFSYGEGPTFEQQEKAIIEGKLTEEDSMPMAEGGGEVIEEQEEQEIELAEHIKPKISQNKGIYSDIIEPKVKWPKEHTPLGQIFLYFGIFLGVFFSDFVYQYQSDLSDFHFSIGSLIFSIAISICLIPLLYDKLKIKPGSPYIYQFSLFFQQGILWKTIFQLF